MTSELSKTPKVKYGAGILWVNRVDALVYNVSSIRKMKLPLTIPMSDLNTLQSLKVKNE